jgi:hypothetical protein
MILREMILKEMEPGQFIAAAAPPSIAPFDAALPFRNLSEIL